MKKEIEKKYNHIVVEKNKYDFWVKNNYFKANSNSKKPPYSIVIPPPNVTGKLHLGHAWDGSLQDTLIRFKKLSGYDTLFLPGMDHAGIATQVKVEQRLKEEGVNRFDLGRKAFLDKVWEWKEEYASTIRQQWEKLGLSLDYSLEKFTYSPELNKLVNHVFVTMYEKKLIYKDKRIVNWDPIQKTAISNIEVIYKDTNGAMYFFKYYLQNSKEYLTVATTRPETMFGDVCVVVNPNDERYKQYIGKNVINPVNNQIIPIIGDDYVEIEFGTGVMKCTPAHDPNDFIIGKKYNLDQVICMNIDGTMNQNALEFENLDRFLAREKLVEKLKNQDLFIKKEEIVHQVGYSERSNAIVEPYLSEQWFVKMDKLANQVLDFQNSDQKINFYPKRFDDVLKKWMQNINDWTISRQLWWGHQIPAWYNKNNDQMYVGIEPPVDIENWVQDEDVLDTWFSSALWPFATLEWNHQNPSKLFERYFPTNVLITGYDIIFFWVARMVFSSLEFTKQKPFNDCLLHGLIRDEQGRKMSKSLGNGVDPMQVVEEFGADSMRYFLLTNSSPGQDLRYSEEKLRASWNFVNKIWNASRFVMLNIDEVVSSETLNSLIKKTKSYQNVADKWILNRLSLAKKNYYESFNKYEFTLTGKTIYNFIWEDYCSWYLELSKAELNSQDFQNKEVTKAVLGYVLKEILMMLHPLMPFISEEIYQNLDLKKSILDEVFENDSYDFEIIGFEEIVIESINKIREFRVLHEIKNINHISFNLNDTNSKFTSLGQDLIEVMNKYLQTLTNSSVAKKTLNTKFTSIPVGDCFLEIENSDFIDQEKQILKLEERKIVLENEIKRSKNLLNNKNFLEKANEVKIQSEKDKAKDYQYQYDLIIEKIKELKNK
ncbi:valyl-tRNA synthetase [Spiroplasma gladiatoris]|uniref:Valine--tRNA ligase n=1 Tax=Spiroplasma gladiatoris TaxID=2143 RepID=A0A4P7AJ14_9MOLU|nr:valine--tRNA ligase [Spiroplasma gladiatoris]QBQ07723.1 valyl-tRNA synthetase [Spiroplasma gladiatoris]